MKYTDMSQGLGPWTRPDPGPRRIREAGDAGGRISGWVQGPILPSCLRIKYTVRAPPHSDWKYMGSRSVLTHP